MVGRENNKKALFVDLNFRGLEFSWLRVGRLLMWIQLLFHVQRLYGKGVCVFRFFFISVNLFYFSRICFLDLENLI